MCGFKMVQLVQSQGMLFTTKHVMYQVKVCFRDLLVCWHFPAPSVHQYVNSHYTSREQVKGLLSCDSVTYHSSPRCASSQALSVLTYHCLVTRALDNAPGYGVYNQTRDVSGQRVGFRDLLVCWHFPAPQCTSTSSASTPHVNRSRATCHVIQSATLATFQSLVHLQPGHSL